MNWIFWIGFMLGFAVKLALMAWIAKLFLERKAKVQGNFLQLLVFAIIASSYLPIVYLSITNDIALVILISLSYIIYVVTIKFKYKLSYTNTLILLAILCLLIGLFWAVVIGF